MDCRGWDPATAYDIPPALGHKMPHMWSLSYYVPPAASHAPAVLITSAPKTTNPVLVKRLGTLHTAEREHSLGHYLRRPRRQEVSDSTAATVLLLSDHYVGAGLLGQLDRLQPVADFADHLEVRLLLQQVAQRRAHQRMVVRQKDLDLRRLIHLKRPRSSLARQRHGAVTQWSHRIPK